ncbi:MAG: tRNA pseudouridine(13) synthase TruD, partial [Thermodesulfobacteria bacterium]|nr:tRNA pseudouridine(13) synthase TruD [Thermodesulfobacteriota bacterium]
MRIKEKPEDFVVYEVADIAPEGRGEHALYRLTKRGATTWDVIGDVARKLRLRAEAIKYGGLKDRHAVSYQFVTIKQGPKRDIEGRNYRLEYLGQTTQPMSKARLRGNRFRILVKGVSAEGLEEEVRLVNRFGVVNYFDDQRFGSVRHGQGFALREIILGNYEKALYLLLVEGSQYEMKRTQEFRDCLRKNWPNVRACIELAPSRWEKNLLEFLSRHRPSKRTFKRALALVDGEYLLMLCHAYQAYIWNETVK